MGGAGAGRYASVFIAHHIRGLRRAPIILQSNPAWRYVFAPIVFRVAPALNCTTMSTHGVYLSRPLRQMPTTVRTTEVVVRLVVFVMKLAGGRIQYDKGIVSIPRHALT